MKIVHIKNIPKIIKNASNESLIDIFKICQKMQIVCERENGIGIAAPQVGIDLHIFLVKGDGTCPLVKENEYGYFVDCTYKPIDNEKTVSLEGCLSLKDDSGKLRFFKVERFNKIKISGYQLITDSGLKLNPIDLELSISQQGAVFQHESDHNVPKLISDIGEEILFW